MEGDVKNVDLKLALDSLCVSQKGHPFLFLHLYKQVRPVETKIYFIKVTWPRDQQKDAAI